MTGEELEFCEGVFRYLCVTVWLCDSVCVLVCEWLCELVYGCVWVCECGWAPLLCVRRFLCFWSFEEEWGRRCDWSADPTDAEADPEDGIASGGCCPEL